MNHLKTDYYKLMELDLKHRRYSVHTIDSYLPVIYNFLQYINVPPSRIGSNHFVEFIRSRTFKSRSSQERYVSALKYFYYNILEKRQKLPVFKRSRKSKTLPKVIDQDVLKDKIYKIKNLKHKAIIAVTYSAALRVSEVINLKITDIDSDRKVILVKQAKGRKDRITPLSDPLLEILRQYYKAYRPETYLFNGQSTLKYSSSSCNKIVKKYLGTKEHMHVLRHSSATAMHENGTDLLAIKEILGHSSLKTTQIYAKVSLRTIKNVEPLL